MNKNEDRIWDVLIEDALRESQAEPKHEMGDRTRRLLQPMGHIGVDRGRSMVRYRRKKWPRYVAGAVACLVIAAIITAGVIWLPKLAETNDPVVEDQQTAEDEPTGEPADDNRETEDQPKEQPEPQDQLKESPEPEDKPEETPEPESQPESPEEQVETPEDPPDEQPEPVPTPEPEPGKPEDVVEEPEDTTTTPEPETQPGKEPRVLLLSGERLEFSRDGESWIEAEDAKEFENALWFKCRQPVDLLAGGVLLRLEGEAQVTIGESDLSLQLRDDDLFVDSRGTNRPVMMTVSEQTLNLQSGAALFEQGTLGTDVSVFDGEVLVGEERIRAGQKGTVKKRGLSDVVELHKSLDDHKFLEGLGARVVYREDFDFGPVTEPDANLEQGRLRKGKIENGLLYGREVFWGYPENIPVETGLVLRIRVRFVDANSVTINQFCEQRNDNYSFGMEDPVVDEWYILEIPVREFRERTTHTSAPQEGESFMNVSLHPNGESPAVEVDWVELIRGR